MSIETTEYVRKPFHVRGVQVTKANFKEVAKWCGGRIHTIHEERGGKEHTTDYIKIDVKHAATPRQTQAFVGDYVLKSDSGFKIYTEATFERTFDEAKRETAAQPVEGIRNV